MAVNVKTYKELSVKLNTQPNIPSKDKNYTFNQGNLNHFIVTYGDTYKGALTATGKAITRVSFGDFLNALGLCLDRLPKTSLARSTVLVAEHKSNKWVAEIAQKYYPKKMGTTPRCLSLGHGGACEYVKNLDKIPVKQWPTTILLFDDAAFSGKQMTGHVTAITEKMMSQKAGGDIYVVIPFITQVAMKALSNIKLPNNIKLNVISEKTIPTLKELLSAEDFNSMNEICAGVLNNNGESDEDSGIATTYFDHKVPNNQSFVFSVIARDTMPRIKPPYIP
jgi:hypothetical protein